MPSLTYKWNALSLKVLHCAFASHILFKSPKALIAHSDINGNQKVGKNHSHSMVELPGFNACVGILCALHNYSLQSFENILNAPKLFQLWCIIFSNISTLTCRVDVGHATPRAQSLWSTVIRRNSVINLVFRNKRVRIEQRNYRHPIINNYTLSVIQAHLCWALSWRPHTIESFDTTWMLNFNAKK